MGPRLVFAPLSGIWLLAAPAAHAGPITLQVGADPAPKSIVALVRAGGAVGTAPCNDAGVAPDRKAGDGRWTCEAVPVVGSAPHVFALVDGRLADGGLVDAEATTVALRVGQGAVQLSTDLALLDDQAPAAPAGPLGVALVQVNGLGEAGVPIVVLAAKAGALQLNCGDDGRFPDITGNDGAPGCAGLFNEGTARVTVRRSGGEQIDLGEVAWGSGPIRFLTVDVGTKTASVEAYPIPLPPEAPAPPEPEPVQDGAAATLPDVEDPARAQPVKAPAPTSPGGPPTGVALALAGAPWVAAAGGIGVAVLALRRRRARVVAAMRTLRRRPGDSWLPGGPTAGDPVAALISGEVDVAGVVLTALEASRRVLLVAPPGVSLPPSHGVGVWEAMVPDWVAVRDGLRALAADPGPPVAVLIVGADTLKDPGAVAPDPLLHLSRELPAGASLCLVAAPGEPIPAWLPRWELSGPPWQARRLP